MARRHDLTVLNPLLSACIYGRLPLVGPAGDELMLLLQARRERLNVSERHLKNVRVREITAKKKKKKKRRDSVGDPLNRCHLSWQDLIIGVPRLWPEISNSRVDVEEITAGNERGPA